ncbi:MAG: signal recognition particle protein Srp54 [Deltaproteobacteria bacterium]|nr:signal recognition particle protein Srp54 [Deltaproteobacteria bacterium]
MLEFLQEKITKLFDKLSKRGLLSEQDIDDALKDIRIALLEADVHYRVVKELLESVKQKVMGEELAKSINPSQFLLGILKAELIRIMGDPAPVKINGTGDIVMLVGLQGTGKTTTAVKLAKYMKDKKGLKPYLVSIDFNRPAAQEQLITLAKANGFPVNEDISSKGYEALKDLRLVSARQGCDFIIVDTAGRLHIDTALVSELKQVKETLNPAQTVLVVDSMMGHDVLKMAEGFMQGVGYDGAIFTKFEGDTRGGAVISFRKIIDKPIFYIGIGEAVSALEPFDPDKLVARIIGSGDLSGLVEKMTEVVTQEDVEDAKHLAKGKFTFQDFIKQLKMVKRIGSIESLFDMVPGFGKLKNNIQPDAVKKDMKVYEAIINSMTGQERSNPDLLNGKRKQRIAKGSGTKPEDVNRLIKRFYESQRMMDILQKGGIKGIKKYLH